MLTKDFLVKKSGLLKIDKSVILREYVQLIILKYLFAETNDVCFKGGTAIRLLFNSFRFSEDLDFTVLREFGVEEVLKRTVRMVDQEVGMKTKLIKDNEFEGVGVRYRLVFESEILRNNLGVKLDFSYRENPLEVVTSVLAVGDYPIVGLPIVVHMSEKEMVAEKVRAILSRDKVRDVFDVWFLLKKGIEVDWRMVEKKMKYYPEVVWSKSLVVDKVAGLKEDSFKRDLNQFLPENYRNLYGVILRETVNFLHDAVR